MNRARIFGWSLTCTALALASACSRFEIKNEMPTAVAQAVVNGVPVVEGEDIPFMGSPVNVTLDPSLSSDPDGSISHYLWLRTDVSAASRFNLGGANAGSGAFAGDPPANAANPTVALPEGEHQYSLWVTDDEGYISAPSTLNLVVKEPSPFMPNAMCMMTYPNPNESCEACVCSPQMAADPRGNGCLELYQNCYENPDMMFRTLCSAIITCAIGASCVGSACYTGGCMAQIDAAAAYPAGGTLANCSMGEANSNACRGANLLGACTNYAGTPPMQVDGPCRAACM